MDKYSIFIVAHRGKIVGFYHSLETSARKRRGCKAWKLAFFFSWNGLQDLKVEKLIL